MNTNVSMEIRKKGKKMKYVGVAVASAVLLTSSVSAASLGNIFTGTITLNNSTHKSAAYSASEGVQVAHTHSVNNPKTGYVEYALGRKNILGKYKAQTSEYLKYTKDKSQYATCKFDKTKSGTYKCSLSTESDYTTDNGYTSCGKITFNSGYLTMN